MQNCGYATYTQNRNIRPLSKVNVRRKFSESCPTNLSLAPDSPRSRFRLSYQFTHCGPCLISRNLSRRLFKSIFHVLYLRHSRPKNFFSFSSFQEMFSVIVPLILFLLSSNISPFLIFSPWRTKSSHHLYLISNSVLQSTHILDWALSSFHRTVVDV